MSNRAQWIICIIVLLLSASFAFAQKSPTNRTQEQDKTAPNSKVPQPCANTFPTPQPSFHPQATISKDDSHYWYDWFWPPEWASWALVVVAIWAACIALNTLQDLKVQTQNTRVASEAAQKSAEVAEKSLKFSERADVLLNKTGLVRGAAPNGSDSRIDIEFQNFGRTRAVNVRFRLNIIIDGQPVSAAEFLPPVSMGASKTYTVSTHKLENFISVEIISNVMTEVKTLRFVSDVIYRDIFGDEHKVTAEGTLDVTRGTFRIEKEETD
jgi:hypothetical protein